MSKTKHIFAAFSCALLAACLVALPAEGGSGRGTLYSVTSLGGSPATYRLAVNSTSGVTVGDHVMAKVSGGGSGVWEVTAKTSSTVTVEDSLTEQNGSEFGAPVAGGADSVWAYSTPTATGLTIIPDGAQHWAAALRRNTYLQSTSAASHALLSSTHSDTLASTVSRGSVIVGNSTPAYAEVAPTVTGTILRFDGTDTAFATLSSVLDTAIGSTRGSILRRGASGWEIVAPGTSGYVLTSNGAGADPTYQASSSSAITGAPNATISGAAGATGGDVNVSGGAASGGRGGDISIVGGDSNNGQGGSFDLTAGNSTNGHGAYLALTATNGDGTNKNGGDITLTAGSATGSGIPGAVKISGRFTLDSAADVASANDLTLGGDGNYFTVTGATTINGIADSGWQSGSVVHLRFASTPTVTNGGSPSAGYEEILLNGSTNWTPTAGSTLTLVYDGSLDSWVELARMTR